MVKPRTSAGASTTEKLKRLRLAELDVDYRKQLQALKRIIKSGRIMHK
jgi:hypothetical protein